MTHHMEDRVGSLTSRAVVTVGPDETLRSVARTLWSESIGVVVVGDERHPVGLISERDVVAAVAQGADPDVQTAEEAMARHLISVRGEDPLYDAASQMLHDDVRHLPVLDDGGTVVGVVSVRDLLRPLLLDALSGQEPQD